MEFLVEVDIRCSGQSPRVRGVGDRETAEASAAAKLARMEICSTHLALLSCR